MSCEMITLPERATFADNLNVRAEIDELGIEVD